MLKIHAISNQLNDTVINNSEINANLFVDPCFMTVTTTLGYAANFDPQLSMAEISKESL